MPEDTLPPMFMVGQGLPALRDANTWKVFMGIEQAGTQGYNALSDYAMAPADEPWVFACIRRLYQAAQSVPLVVRVTDGKDKLPASDTNHQGGRDAQWLLDNVNPVDMNGGDLKAWTVAGLSLWGEGWLQKLRGRFGGAPQELYYLRAPDMQPAAGYFDQRFPPTWMYQPSRGQGATLSWPRDLVVFKTPNLQDPWRGLSPISAIRKDIEINKNATIHAASVLKNHSIPAGAWTPEPGKPVSNTDRRLIQRVFEAVRGPRNAGKSVVLPTSLTWHQMGLSPKDAEYLGAKQVSRMTICAALGVPLVLAGDDEKISTYANLRDARKIMWQDTVIPLLDWIADVLQGWLLPDFDAADPQKRVLSVGFDYSQIEALQEPLETQLAAWGSLLDRRVITVNEFRAHFRLGAAVPWGNEEPLGPTRIALKGDIPPQAIPGSGPQAPAAERPDETLEPGGLPEIGTPDIGEALRAYGPLLYRHPAVRRYLADPAQPLDVASLLGGRTSIAVRHTLETGLHRRYTVEQLVGGVPAERFAGLAAFAQGAPA